MSRDDISNYRDPWLGHLHPLDSHKLIPKTLFVKAVSPNLRSIQQGIIDRKHEQSASAGTWATDVGHEPARIINCSGSFASSALGVLAEARLLQSQDSHRRHGLDLLHASE